MKKIILIAIFFINATAFSQLVFNTSYHNFGEIEKQDKKYFDFTLTNAGTEKAIIFKVEEPYGIDVKFSKKEILPDSTIIVRIKYTPKRKGSYKKDIPIWVNVNNEPITFTVEGFAKSFDINESLDCPEFTPMKNTEKLRTNVNITIIDKATKKPIKNATLEIIWDWLVYKTLTTNNKGETTQLLKYDNYYFVINAKGYQTVETDIEITGKEMNINFEMGEGANDILIVQKDTLIDEPFVIDKKDTISTKELPVNLYKANNIVFCIDVSVSMKQKGRFDLLKAAMIELLNGLRPIDKLAIVTYSSSTETVLKSQYVTDKATIQQLIMDLTAGGYTAGAKGIKKAYRVARSSFIEGANNQVILSTDGGFYLKTGDKGVLSDVQINYEKGISISVVGVKNDRATEKSMKEIAKTGGGNYIHIKSYAQAKPLLMNEIKTKSRK